MRVDEEASSVVLRLFGRPLLAEDWRLIGRWSFAAAWLAEDDASARQLVRARLGGASSLATSAALAAGRGDAERFTLVTALARLATSSAGGEGTLAQTASRIVEERVTQTLHEGAALRSAVARERAALAPGFDLETFTRAISDVGQERHVLLREAFYSLEAALTAARGECPALRTLRLFLQATLAQESSDAAWQPEGRPEGEGSPFRTLALWLASDLALAQGLSPAVAAAWSTAARESGDALSRALATAHSGATVSRGIVQALKEEPWTLSLALAATTTPGGAVTLLDLAGQAQKAARAAANEEVAAWRSEASALAELEVALGVSAVLSAEVRVGFNDLEIGPGQDLFTAWYSAQLARDCANSLSQANERTVASEAERLRNEVRLAETKLEALRCRYEDEVAASNAQAGLLVPRMETGQAAEGRAQRGCLLGTVAGASVIVAYVVVGLVVGTSRAFDQLAPLVVAVAALPFILGTLGYVTVVAHRANLSARRARLVARSRESLTRQQESLRKEYENARDESQGSLSLAEADLAQFERRTSTDRKAA